MLNKKPIKVSSQITSKHEISFKYNESELDDIILDFTLGKLNNSEFARNLYKMGYIVNAFKLDYEIINNTISGCTIKLTFWKEKEK